MVTESCASVLLGNVTVQKYSRLSYFAVPQDNSLHGFGWVTAIFYLQSCIKLHIPQTAVFYILYAVVKTTSKLFLNRHLFKMQLCILLAKSDITQGMVCSSQA